MQWFQRGDHPRVLDMKLCREDSVFRWPRPDDERCPACGIGKEGHGLIAMSGPERAPTPGYRMVCPGDWVIDDGDKCYPCKPDEFKQRWEAIPPQ